LSCETRKDYWNDPKDLPTNIKVTYSKDKLEISPVDQITAFVDKGQWKIINTFVRKFFKVPPTNPEVVNAVERELALKAAQKNVEMAIIGARRSRRTHEKAIVDETIAEEDITLGNHKLGRLLLQQMDFFEKDSFKDVVTKVLILPLEKTNH
jgi:hypothetical protein